MQHTSQVLLVVTSADTVRGMPDPTGSWLEEVAAPYYAFTDAGCAVTLASPKGGNAPLDKKSFEEQYQTADSKRFMADREAMHLLANTQMLSAINFQEYDAVFFAGGHGTMEDFPTDASVKGAVEYFYGAGKPVSAVCHGPACFVAAVKPTGAPLMQGHRFTCFTDAEETAVELHTLVPFMLESTLQAQGGVSETAEPFAARVVVDLPLITGQNPASAVPTAKAVLGAMLQSATRNEAVVRTASIA